MRLGRTSAFVLLALLAGGIISQLPLAMADDSDSPFSALWDAIFDLQGRDDALQAQIDELRAERNALLVQTESEPVFTSDLYATIEVQAAEDGRTLVYITAGNSGPDRAAGVKLTAFYTMSLFEINLIDGSLCEDKSRGIIECIIGTLEEGQESVITIDATPRESGQVNTWTVDISTTTEDSDFSNNHVTYDFETGSAERVEAPQVEQPEQEPEVEEPEQDASEPTDGAETEEPQENAGNQTVSETMTEDTSNSTNTEIEESESSGNQTSSDSNEETVNESNTNSSGTEIEDTGSEQHEEAPEETSEEPAQEQSDEQGAPGESAVDESSESGEENPGSEESQPESEQEESDESGESSEQESPPQ